MDLLDAMAASARASAGFFWKSAWAFVMGYAISAMIQVFVPRRRLHRQLGRGGTWSVPLASLYGALSSSCSFAALAAARTLVAKGASIVAGVAFMFASTNLVVELGALILIFLGPTYLVAELAGGVLLIAISSVLIGTTLSDRLADEMRRRAGQDAPEEQDEFDWRRRLVTREGWRRVGRRFGAEWGMAWEEIVIGFTVAGLMAALVPDGFWQALFLAGREELPGPVRSLENALVGPLVAAATFIGSMGNIPLATVLAGSGVSFAGVMAFIYSDLMVPPLVRVNAKYYGLRGALYVAAVMYVAVVLTALVVSGVLALLGVEAGETRALEQVSRFAVDHTFWLNAVFAPVAAGLVLLARGGEGRERDARRPRLRVQRVVVLACALWVGSGLVVGLFR